MFRATLLVLVVAGAAAGAPVPKAAKKDFFPLKAGYKWEFVGESTFTMEVTNESELPNKNGTEYEVTYTQHKANLKLYFAVSEDDLLLTRTSPDCVSVLKSPATYLKLPLASGAKWDRVYQYQKGGQTEFRVKAGEFEAIKIQGREYKACPVRWEEVDSNRQGCEWYAEGVGLVRKDRGGDTLTELKAFTAGGPKKK